MEANPLKGEVRSLHSTDSDKDIQPGVHRKLLAGFVGRWNTEGEILQTASSPAMKLSGTDTYEWLKGGYFLIHHVDVRTGTEPMNAIEIIGYNAAEDVFETHSFDSQGKWGKYRLTELKGVWTLAGPSERATIQMNASGNTMNIQWEQLTNEKKWIPWIIMKLTKVM